ncbi:hypothetical protein [Faecalimicrobium sp. JNUCC 81]
MPKIKSIHRGYDIEKCCNGLANQYLVLVTIFAAIISQEIENDEDLGILGSFLVSLGEELALSSEIRIACREKLENQNSSDEIVEDVFDRCSSNPKKKVKKIKRKYIKRKNKPTNN